MQREMYADGVLMEEIKHFLKYLHKAYMKACIVNRAGCNLNDKRFHSPTWGAILSENVMKLVMPDLST